MASTQVGSDYTIDGLPSGTYYVRYRSAILSFQGNAGGGDYPPQLYRDVACDSLDCPLTRVTARDCDGGRRDDRHRLHG